MVVQPGLCQTWSKTLKTDFLTTQLNYVLGGGGGQGGGALHDKTSNICLQLIMHKAKFNVYPYELENDHLHKNAKDIST